MSGAKAARWCHARYSSAATNLDHDLCVAATSAAGVRLSPELSVWTWSWPLRYRPARAGGSLGLARHAAQTSMIRSSARNMPAG